MAPVEEAAAVEEPVIEENEEVKSALGFPDVGFVTTDDLPKRSGSAQGRFSRFKVLPPVKRGVRGHSARAEIPSGPNHEMRKKRLTKASHIVKLLVSSYALHATLFAGEDRA